MKLTKKKLAWLAFAAYAALLVLWPQRENPEMIAEVRCASEAVVLVQYIRENPAAGELDPWDRYSRVLGRQVETLRKTGRAEPLQMGGIVAELVRERDQLLADGQADAYLRRAMPAVEACMANRAGGTAA